MNTSVLLAVLTTSEHKQKNRKTEKTIYYYFQRFCDSRTEPDTISPFKGLKVEEALLGIFGK